MADSRENLLEIDNLHKSYGQLKALDGISLSLADGERLALLGPNGAGKTTLIRCLSGRTRPNQGEVRLGGQLIGNRGVRDAIGVVPQEIALYSDLTTRENLWAFGRFHGLPRARIQQRLDWALLWTGLQQRADDLVGGFSGGMKRRVNLACGVMHAPKLLLLDEPTVGVDPQSRERIFTMLDELSRGGTSILLTTHHLDEAEQRSDRIVILDRGHVIADGPLDQLVRDSIGTSRLVRVRLNRPLVEPLVIGRDQQSTVVGQAGDDQVTTRVDTVSTELPMLFGAVRDQGYDVSDVEVQNPSLHHVFLHLTGHELRD